MAEPRRILFSFWGRRGALAQFALELARAALGRNDLRATISISRQNELFDAFAALDVDLLAIDTFAGHAGAALGMARVPALRRRLAAAAELGRYEAVIELIPHVWSPFLIPPLLRSGARYATIIHDAAAHPGDRTALVKPILDRPMRAADRVLTLSETVAQALVAQGRVTPERLRVLFHPDFAYGPAGLRRRPAAGEPWRLLFLGRIMPYKGLSLFVEAVERLRGAGVAVLPMVHGEGALGENGPRLAALGAEIVNRWLRPEEIAAALGQAHALVLSHIEASQSGVAAAALGAELPVVATPVGALVEQIEDGTTGILARAASGEALAAALMRLIAGEGAYEHVLEGLSQASGRRSMGCFLDAAARATLD